ncbi:MAG: hypothetical protein IKZ37_04235 [Bacteroidaceae bacterium]|nr:hypothetical protein [Bacteroidaceae bacterium]
MKDAKNNIFTVIRRLIAIILVIIPIFLWIASPLNFTTLGLIALAAILLPTLTRRPHLFLDKKELNNFFGLGGTGTYIPFIRNNTQGTLAIIFLAIYSVITVSTLNNYFYADENIYTNNQHHILRLDSITIKNTKNFVLAGSDDNALFDNKGYNGKITIDSYDEKSVRLKLNNFSQPVYKYRKVSKDKRSFLNKDKEIRRDTILNSNLLSFRAGVIDTPNKQEEITPDSLVFTNNNGDKVYFWITECNIDKGFFSSFKENTDTAVYHFSIYRNGNNTPQQITSKTTFICKEGLGLNYLLDGVTADGFNFDGVNIARCATHQQSNRDERSDGARTRYALSLDSIVYRKTNDNNAIASIASITHKNIVSDTTIYKLDYIYNDSITLNLYELKNEKKVPIEIMIGYGVNKTAPFYFSFNNDTSLNIVFKEPVSHQLHSNNSNKTNTLYVTSSLIKDTENASNKEKEFGINVPNNILLFNILNRRDNANRFTPFNLSFVPGHTTDSLILLCNYKDKVFEKRVNENISISTLGNENVVWNFSMANLREETRTATIIGPFKIPIKPHALLWVVFAVALLAIASMAMQVGFSYQKETFHRNTFNYVEYIMYVVLIFLVAMRCFIVWRTMVFRPVEDISQIELNDIIYQTTAFRAFICGIIMFFGIIFLLKLYIYCSHKMIFHNNSYTTYYGDISIKLTPAEELALRASSDSIYNKIHNLLYKILLCETAIDNDEGILTRLVTAALEKMHLDKMLNIYLKTRDILKSLFREFRSLSFGFKFSLVWVIMALLSVAISNPRFIIVMLVISYFYIDMVIYANNKYNSYKAEEVDNKEGEIIVSSLLYSLLNMIITMGLMFVFTHDTGFVIMFATFSLASMLLKVLELYTKMFRSIGSSLFNIYLVLMPIIIVVIFTLYKEIVIDVIFDSYLIFWIAVILTVLLWLILRSSYITSGSSQNANNTLLKKVLHFLVGKTDWNIKDILLIIVLPVVLIVTLALYKDAIEYFINFILLFAVVGLLLFAYFKWEAFKYTMKYFFNIKRIIFSIVVATFTAGIIFIIEDKSPADSLGRHTLQRINVQVYNDEPHKALALTETSGDEIRFLQASHNHWIIEQYYNRGREINAANSNGYFRLQPQSKVGAMWNAQLTDIVLLRYVIAEHGTFLPILIIALFLVMLYYGLKKTTYYRFTKSILTQIPLLILVQAVLVWLANTQRFVFFGQDFPMLSITSSAMVIYFLALTAIWVCAAIIESIMCRAYKEEDEYGTLNTFNKKTSIRFCSYLIFAVILLIIVKQIRQISNNDNRYSMSELFNMTDSYVTHIDSSFVNYQEAEKSLYNKSLKKKPIKYDKKNFVSYKNNSAEFVLNSNMHSVINDFNNNYKITDTINIDNNYTGLLLRARAISNKSEFLNAIDSAFKYSNSSLAERQKSFFNIFNALKSDNDTTYTVVHYPDTINTNSVVIKFNGEEQVNYAYHIHNDTIIKTIKDSVLNKKTNKFTDYYRKEKVALNNIVEQVSVEASIMRIPLNSIIRANDISAQALHIFDSIADTREYKYMQRIWRKYVESGSSVNSYGGLLHIHKVGSNLRIAMRDTYYDVTLPNHNRDEWKGSIVEHYEPYKLSDTLIRRGTKQYTYYQLPRSWIRERETPHILNVKDDSLRIFSLDNNEIVQTENSGIESILALYKDDIVKFGKDVLNGDSLPVDVRKYWARNILVNGRQSFIYPQGKSLFWIWHFANAVKGQKDRKLRESAGSQNEQELYADVAITLDSKLTDSVRRILDNKIKKAYKILGKKLGDSINKAVKETPNHYRLKDQMDNKLLAFSVIIADDNGHIHAMVDAKDSTYNINPNDHKQIGELNEMFYMNFAGNRNEQERYYIDNMNLTHMRGGPGSTQKPLMWTAVASRIKDLKWNSLDLKHKNNLRRKERGYYILPQYNGAEMLNMEILQSDEWITCDKNGIKVTDKNAEYMDLTNFLSRSSNYYNAMMVYFGLQPDSCYRNNKFINLNTVSVNRTQNYLFKKALPESEWNKEYYNDNYPFIQHNHNEKEILTFNRQIKLEDYTNSVLYKQFIENYGLRANFSPIDTTYLDNNGNKRKSTIRRYAKNLYKEYFSIENNNSTFSLPELSILNLRGYYEEMTDSLNYHRKGEKTNDKDTINETNGRYANNGMRNITVGGKQMWIVTPYEMAQMYGKMFTLNTNYALTLDPNTVLFDKNDINIGRDKNDKDTVDNKNFYEALPIAFNSMNLFFTHGTGRTGKEIGILNFGDGDQSTYVYDGKRKGNKNGKGKGKGNKNGKGNENEKGKVNEKTYYLYGKTGTSNEDKIFKGEKTKNEFRRLAIIISDTKLHNEVKNGSYSEVDTAEVKKNAKKAKFFVLYFTLDYDASLLNEIAREVIEEVIHSEAFQNYMKPKN